MASRYPYIDQVLKEVRFYLDHPGIRRELEEHIEDLLQDRADSQDTGGTFQPADAASEDTAIPEDADSYIRRQMGDPAELGRELNREHHAVLGWLWYSSRLLLFALILFWFLPRQLPALVMTAASVIEGYEESDKVPAAHIEPDIHLAIDDIRFVIDELVQYEDDTVEIRYRRWKVPFSCSADWSFDLSSFYFTDDLGTDFTGSWNSDAGYLNFIELVLENFNPDARVLILDYDKHGRQLHAEIPLDWEVIP